MAEVATTGPTPVPDAGEPVPLDTIPVSPNGAMTDVTNGADKFADGEQIVTVFDDPANFNVKHQLQHTWTLWFTKPPSGKQDWNELLKEVISFDSVEEFWGIYVGNVVHTQTSQVLTKQLEQHHPRLRTRPKVGLPSLQARRPPRMGRSTKQARRPLVIHFQRQQSERRDLAQHHASGNRRDARGRV